MKDIFYSGIVKDNPEKQNYDSRVESRVFFFGLIVQYHRKVARYHFGSFGKLNQRITSVCAVGYRIPT